MLSTVHFFQASDILRVSNGFIRNYSVNGYRDVKVNVIAAGHLCEIQLHLRTFYSLKDGQHEVYEWSRTLDITADMEPMHLFKNFESGTLQLMTQLSRENWCSTGLFLAPLLVESGQYEEARALLREVSIFSKHFMSADLLSNGNSFWCSPRSLLKRCLGR